MKFRSVGIFSLLLVMLAGLGAGCRPYHRRGLEIDVDIHSKDHHKHHHDNDDHDRDDHHPER